MAESNNSAAWAAAAGAAASTAANYIGGIAQSKKQFEYQRKAMQIQKEYNDELWERQNAYNTPQQQMARLEAAGLNPYLIYNGGANNAGNAGPVTPTDVPSRNAVRPEFSDVQMRRLQIRQMDAQYAATMQAIESNRTKAALDSVRTSLESLKVLREDMRKQNYGKLNQAELDTAQFVALKSAELFNNERSKGGLLTQMYGQREEMFKRQIKAADLENEFKVNRNELAKFGIYQSDNALLRVLLQAAHRQGVDLNELLSRGVDALKYLMP